MARPAPKPWHIVGCGRMGSLAAAYLHGADTPVQVIRDHGPREQAVHLVFADDRSMEFDLPVIERGHTGPIERLVVACKTAFTADAMAGLDLADDALIFRLQNGIGSLDGRLAGNQRLIEIVTASAVKSRPDGALAVVAENRSVFGGGPAPALWQEIAARWPKTEWHVDIRPAQWQKMVVNAVLNPLTALHDIPNGALVEQATLRTAAAELADEADRVLAALDPTWPGGSLDNVLAVASATAANTSSMRADLLAGQTTEIEAINGWLIARAEACGMAVPAHRDIAARVRARHPAP